MLDPVRVDEAAELERLAEHRLEQVARTERLARRLRAELLVSSPPEDLAAYQRAVLKAQRLRERAVEAVAEARRVLPSATPYRFVSRP